jgi:large subunit ribosomal protein L46
MVFVRSAAAAASRSALRLVGCPGATVRRAAASPSSSSRGTWVPHTLGRPAAFSTNASPPSSSLYYAKKQAAKDRRRELFETKVERQHGLQSRRVNRPRLGQNRRDFRSFFIKKKVDEEYMERKARQAGLDWKINVAVILERPNVVLPDKEDWEVEYEDLQAHLAQFGKMYPKGLVNVDYDAKVAMTDEELLALLPEGFRPAPRETEADETGNVRTVDRKLKTSIYLTVQDDGKWMLPTVSINEDETFLEAAQRALGEKVGPEVEYWSPSNCPCAADMVALPAEERKGVSYGTKTFFMKLQYDEGAVSQQSMKVDDYAWLDRGEITEQMREEQGDYMAKFYHYLM